MKRSPEKFVGKGIAEENGRHRKWTIGSDRKPLELEVGFGTGR